MKTALKGAKVVVTGGSKGYGAGIAAVLVEPL
jgi:NAD(P)-dependent dehydrogenase (short-subunit alcohol dehydrogenase family)